MFSSSFHRMASKFFPISHFISLKEIKGRGCARKREKKKDGKSELVFEFGILVKLGTFLSFYVIF